MRQVPRPLEELVEQEALRWQAEAGTRPRQAPARPVVTISRQHGAGGGALARRLAEELGLKLYDREIIHRIAESAHASERLVFGLDEKDRETLTDMLTAALGVDYLSLPAYRDHLMRVVSAIGWQGGAVILGRGAHLILGPERALRVMVIAPLSARVSEIAAREGLSQRAAECRIAEVEAERRAFLARHFRSDPVVDLTAFDLIVNTGVLGIEGGLAAVRQAIAERPLGPCAPRHTATGY
jgi:cytidylate kinase